MDLKKELEIVLSRYCAENGAADMPIALLAEYLMDCLSALDKVNSNLVCLSCENEK
jgi:hypothetical protein